MSPSPNTALESLLDVSALALEDPLTEPLEAGEEDRSKLAYEAKKGFRRGEGSSDEEN